MSLSHGGWVKLQKCKFFSEFAVKKLDRKANKTMFYNAPGTSADELMLADGVQYRRVFRKIFEWKNHSDRIFTVKGQGLLVYFSVLWSGVEAFCYWATFSGEAINQSTIYQDFTPSFCGLGGGGCSCRNANFHSEFVVKKLDRKANKTMQCPLYNDPGTSDELIWLVLMGV